MSKLTRHLSIRVTDEFPRKLRIAAAIEGIPQAVLLEKLLDQQEQRLRSMRSPLHRPTDDDDH